MLAQVSEATKNSDRKEKTDTIFTSIIQSDIPRSEVTKERLQHEAIGVVGAGIETSMRALTISIYHIVNNPSTYHRLREELFAAIPDPEKMPSWTVLQKLPFLAACIEECEDNLINMGISIINVFDISSKAFLWDCTASPSPA